MTKYRMVMVHCGGYPCATQEELQDVGHVWHHPRSLLDRCGVLGVPSAYTLYCAECKERAPKLLGMSILSGLQ